MALLNKFELRVRYNNIRKPLARKLMTLLYRSLRDDEELCMESDCRHCARVIERQLALIDFLHDVMQMNVDDRQMYQMVDICFEFSGGRCRSDRVRRQLMKFVKEHIGVGCTTGTTPQHVIASGVLNTTILWPLTSNAACSDVVDATYAVLEHIHYVCPWEPEVAFL